MDDIRPAVDYGGFRTSDSISDIATALAAAQAEYPEIQKERSATVKGRTKTGNEYSYDYKYADIADVLAGVRPVLAKHEIAMIQPVVMRAGAMYVLTRLIHKSGEWIECEYPVTRLEGRDQGHQTIAGALTYARRYSLCTLVGVAAEEDIDAGEGAATVEERRPERPAARQERRPPQVVQAPEPPPADDPDAARGRPLPPTVGEDNFQVFDEKKSTVGGPTDADTYVDRFCDMVDAVMLEDGAKASYDALLSANATELDRLPERLKKVVESNMEGWKKRLRAKAVDDDPAKGEGGEGKLI